VSKQSEAVRRWRKNTKQKLIDAFGGKCAICEYNKCNEVFEFHHLDPSEKDFQWSQVNGSIRSWSVLVHEMQKCVMLCSNCHKEVHAGVAAIPVDVQRFDDTLIRVQWLYVVDVHDNCPVCGGQKVKSLTTCSVECARRNKIRIVDWDIHNVVELVEQYKTYTAVGELLGVTGAAVARKYKRVTQK